MPQKCICGKICVNYAVMHYHGGAFGIGNVLTGFQSTVEYFFMLGPKREIVIVSVQWNERAPMKEKVGERGWGHLGKGLWV